MKTSIITSTLVLFFCMAAFFTSAKTRGTYPGDSLDFLEVNGQISHIVKGLDGPCKVDLYHANKIVDSMTLKKGKRKFSFYLMKNAYYTIRISKPGYVDRLVCVNTSIPKKHEEDIHTFDFTTDLITLDESLHLDTHALDFPIAVVYFDKDDAGFNHCPKYTKALKKELFSTLSSK